VLGAISKATGKSKEDIAAAAFKNTMDFFQLN
jgi:hypothetical protein